MHKGFYFYLQLAFFPLLMQGQFSPSYKTNYALGNFIQLSADGYFISNSITNEFAEKFYNRGHIDDKTKENVKDKLGNKNNIGAEFTYGINWYYKPDTFLGSSNLAVMVSLKNTQLFNASFSKDLFNVGFYGNKSYAGETAYLGNLHINSLNYQQLSFGALWTGLDTSRAKIGFVLSAIKGEKLYSVSAPRADLYTSQGGEYIEFKTISSLKRSDPSSRGIGSLNGFGAGCGLFFEAPYKLKRRSGMVSISIKDVGFIYWNTKSQNIVRDTTFYFDGFKVTNLFELQDSTFSNAGTDSVLNTMLPFKNKSFMTPVPATMELLTCTNYGKFMFIKGFKKIFNANYREYFFIEGDYTFSKYFALTLHAGYGGYGKLQTGMQARIMLGDTFLLRMGSQYIQGFVLKTATGISGYFNMIKYF